uniref:G-protein coupled receptors family 1 profile domain-containing protein n=1 Tax=Magallana gigas TaxID=29159 RepID=A0A8W8LHL2_MAGGI
MNKEVTLELVNRVMADDRLPVSVIMIITNSIGAVANFTIVFVFLFRLTKWMDSGRFFVPFLALNDAIVCIVGTIYRVYLNFYFITPKSNILCQMGNYFLYVFVVISSIILLLIAVDRFLLFYQNGKKSFSLKQKWISLFVAVVIAAISGSTIWIFYGELEVQVKEYRNFNVENVTFYQCSEKQGRNIDMVGMIITLCVVFCQMIVMAVLYSYIARIIYTAFKKTTQRKEKNAPAKQDSMSKTSSFELGPIGTKNDSIIKTERKTGRSRERFNILWGKSLWRQTMAYHFRKHRFTYTFMVLTGVYAFNRFPSMVIKLMAITVGEHTFWHQLTYSQLQASLIADSSDIFDSTIHPFIYGFLDTKLREEIKGMFNGRK